MSIGFIGLGNIGKPMAKHLLQLGEPVHVYDVFEPGMQELAGLGAVAAASPAALAKECRHIGLCVRDDRDVEQLLYGAGGLLDNAAAGTLIAIHSTVTQAGILRWRRDAAEHGIDLIDAPITGGAGGAEQGTLCYMVGGDVTLLERCRAIFMTSAEKIVHAGPVGAGIALKLCNNLMTYAAFAAMHEAANLARECGLSLESLHAVGQSNGVVTPQMYSFVTGRDAVAAQGEQALEQAFGPFARLGEKDLEAALQSGRQLGLEMPATECVQGIIGKVFLKRY